MKTILAVLALGFALAVSTPAQEAAGAAAKINTKIAVLNDINDKVKTLDTTDLDALKAKKRNLDDVTDMLKGAVAHLQAKDADLTQEFAANDAAVAQHNANQCVEKNHDGSCSAYQAEANRLNARTQELKQRESDLNTYRHGLKERYDQLTQDTLDWTAAAKKHDGDRQDLVDKYKSELGELGNAANEYGNCVDRYPKDDDEGLKHHCGNVQFDGVRESIGKLRQYGTGTHFFGQPQ